MSKTVSKVLLPPEPPEKLLGTFFIYHVDDVGFLKNGDDTKIILSVWILVGLVFFSFHFSFYKNYLSQKMNFGNCDSFRAENLVSLPDTDDISS